jgi:hypothetical protein
LPPRKYIIAKSFLVLFSKKNICLHVHHTKAVRTTGWRRGAKGLLRAVIKASCTRIA